MAKFCGLVGYATLTETDPETSPGVFKEVITERKYYGDIVRNNRRLQTTDQVNDNINVANEISIVADPFANQNFYSMRYVWYMGARWKISNVDASLPPRLILTLGGLYNGKQNKTT